MDPEDLQNSSFCNKNQSETSIDQYSLISYNSIDQYPDYGSVDSSRRRNSIVTIDSHDTSIDKHSLISYNSIAQYPDYDSVDSSTKWSSIVSIDSHDINKQPTKQVNSIAKWIDSIYDLFQEPEPESNSVDELLNDNISYEESEVRIIALASILALSLSLIASAMLGFHATNSSPTRQIILNYDPPVSKPKSRTPHVALLFFDGRMNIYELNSSNQHLEFRWNITIRTPKNDGQYFSFQEQDPIHVFYGDMQKVITIIQSETDYKNKKMRNILSNETFQKSGYFRVGNYLWIFGGYINMKEHWEWIGDPRKTMVWQIQKQRWIWGPDIPFYDPELENNLWHKPFIHQGSTGFSRSQNVGVIIFFNQALSKQGCMVAMAFDFSIQRWTKIDKCFYLLDNVPIQAISLASGIHTTSKILLRSASYFNKSAEL